MRSWVFGWTLVRPGHRIFVFLCRGVVSFQCSPFSQCRPLGKLGLHEDGEATAPRHCRVHDDKLGRWRWSMFRVSPRVSTVAR